MFLIYIIGGIIPFVIATFYISQQSRNLILEQNKKAQQEEVALIGSSIEESMEVATDVGKQIYSDAAVRNIITKIAQKEYKDTDEFTQTVSACSLLINISNIIRKRFMISRYM